MSRREVIVPYGCWMLLAILARRLDRLRFWRNRRTGEERPAVQPGEVLTLTESDYQYGLGPLRLRVEHVDRVHVLTFDGENWYQVFGVQVTADGKELSRRQVLVRGSRVGAAGRTLKANGFRS